LNEAKRYLINNFKDHNAAGFDRLAAKPLIKHCTIQVNNCQTFKNMNKKIMSNYILTSMIIFFKTIRKIVKSKLINFLEKDKLLSINQFEFRLGLWAG